MDDFLGGLVALIFIVALVLTLAYWMLILAGLLIVTVAQGVLTGGDWLFGARLIPVAPYVAWAAAGMLIGASFGFWTAAPMYGYRGSQRTWILVAPFLFLSFALILDGSF